MSALQTFAEKTFRQAALSLALMLSLAVPSAASQAMDSLRTATPITAAVVEDSLIIPVARYDGRTWRNVSGQPWDFPEKDSLRHPRHVWRGYERDVERWHFRSSEGASCVLMGGPIVRDDPNAMTWRWGLKSRGVQSGPCRARPPDSVYAPPWRTGIALSRDLPMVAVKEVVSFYDTTTVIPPPVRALIDSVFAARERAVVSSLKARSAHGEELRQRETRLLDARSKGVTASIRVDRLYRSGATAGGRQFIYFKAAKRYKEYAKDYTCPGVFVRGWITRGGRALSVLDIDDPYAGSCYDNKGRTLLQPHGIFVIAGRQTFALAQVHYWEGARYTLLKITPSGVKEVFEQ